MCCCGDRLSHPGRARRANLEAAAGDLQSCNSAPDNVAAWRRVLGPSVSFEAEVSGIVFALSWLDMPIEGADPDLYHILARAIRTVQAHGALSFAEKVERALPQMLLSGMASADAVARLFAIHERTLRRRLEAEGRSLQQLINQTRF